MASMRLTLQLTAIDHMSRVVTSAAQRSMQAMQGFQANARQIQSNARAGMMDAGVAFYGGIQGMRYPLEMASKYETLRVKMDALTGSTKEGGMVFKEVLKMAQKTPLDVDQIGTATSRLMGFGRSAREALVDIKMLGDVVTVSGGDIDLAMIAYGQAAGEGRVMTRDLTQLVNAGVPIFKMLEKVVGTGKPIKKMAEDGQLTFEVLRKAFEVATASGGQFANGMEVMSGTSAGVWVRLTDTLGQFAAVFGDSVMPALKSFGEALIPILQSSAEWFREHKKLSQALMVGTGIIVGIAGATFFYNAAVWGLAGAYSAVMAPATMFILKHVGLLQLLKWLGRQFFFLRFSIFATSGAGTFMTNVTNIGLIPAILKAIWAGNLWIANLLGISATIYGIPIIGWILAVVAAIIAIGVAVYKNWDAIRAFFTDMWQMFKDFLPKAKAWGANLIDTIVAGIKSAAPMLFNAIDGVMTFTRGFFPSSPAKRGAFKDINKIGIIEHVAKNVNHKPLSSAINGATNAAAIALSPSSPAAINSVNNGGSASVVYSPTITFGGAVSDGEKTSFQQMLETHKTEIARMVQEAARSQNRKSFA